MRLSRRWPRLCGRGHRGAGRLRRDAAAVSSRNGPSCWSRDLVAGLVFVVAGLLVRAAAGQPLLVAADGHRRDLAGRLAAHLHRHRRRPDRLRPRRLALLRAVLAAAGLPHRPAPGPSGAAAPRPGAAALRGPLPVQAAALRAARRHRLRVRPQPVRAGDRRALVRRGRRDLSPGCSSRAAPRAGVRRGPLAAQQPRRAPDGRAGRSRRRGGRRPGRL